MPLGNSRSDSKEKFKDDFWGNEGRTFIQTQSLYQGPSYGVTGLPHGGIRFVDPGPVSVLAKGGIPYIASRSSFTKSLERTSRVYLVQAKMRRAPHAHGGRRGIGGSSHSLRMRMLQETQILCS